MRSKENEPRFINGLKMAKNILLEMRAKKMEEIQLQSSSKTTPVKEIRQR